MLKLLNRKMLYYKDTTLSPGIIARNSYKLFVMEMRILYTHLVNQVYVMTQEH